MGNLPRLRAMITANPWAILPGMLETIAEIVERRCEGIYLSQDEIAALKGSRDVPNGMLAFFDREVLAFTPASRSAGGQQPQSNAIAVLSIFGVIAQHASQIDNVSGPGGTSIERVTQSFRAALAEPAISAIVLNFDSPGGNVFGVQALADEIYRARGKKPIIAQANSMAASAAYWLATQADEIVVIPGGQVGSIGAYAMHEDLSKAAENKGVKYTFISAGKYKIEGNSFEPLTTEAAQATQRMVDAYYGDFVGAVARGRGVSTADVRNGFGQGRMEKDRNAVAARMADRIGTLDDTLRRLSAKRSIAGATNASIAGNGEMGARSQSREEDFRRRRHRFRMRDV